MIMKNHLKFLMAFIGLFSVSLHAFAQNTITVDDVLASSAAHYPEIKAALETIEEREGGIVKSLGAFDASVDSDYYNRVAGFYDGQYLDTKIIKPFQDYGAKATFGYRYSEGDYPVYEDYFFTNEGGEINASISLSLLRNRDIDPARFRLNNSEIQLDRAYIDLLEKQLDIQNRAYDAYLDWLAAGKELAVYQELLSIATKRQKALKTKVSKGDIAEIMLTENQQFILQRRETLLEAERKFNNAINKLGLFLRDDTGTMLETDYTQLPATFPISPNLDVNILEERIEGIMLSVPNVRRLEAVKAEADNQIALGENNVLPAFDLTFGAADDFGDRFNSREDPEATVRVSVSVPLQKRYGAGDIQQGEAKKQRADYDKNLMLDQLKINFRNILNNIQAGQEIVGVTEQEIDVTQKMERAEITRFENGQSDFFLVNIREVNKTNARINNIKALKYLSSVYADYLAMSLDLDELKIEE